MTFRCPFISHNGIIVLYFFLPPITPTITLFQSTQPRFGLLAGVYRFTYRRHSLLSVLVVKSDSINLLPKPFVVLSLRTCNCIIITLSDFCYLRVVICDVMEAYLKARSMNRSVIISIRRASTFPSPPFRGSLLIQL